MEPGFFNINGKKLKIEPIVGMFDIWPMEEALPFPRLTIKVVCRGPGDYQASTNVSVRNVANGNIEYTCGLGSTVDDAVRDALHYFLGEVEKQSQFRKLGEQDFVWDKGDDGPPADDSKEEPVDVAHF